MSEQADMQHDDPNRLMTNDETADRRSPLCDKHSMWNYSGCRQCEVERLEAEAERTSENMNNIRDRIIRRVTGETLERAAGHIAAALAFDSHLTTSLRDQIFNRFCRLAGLDREKLEAAAIRADKERGDD